MPHVQVLVAESFLDNTRCYNMSGVQVSFVDNGMDAGGECSATVSGGCSFEYNYVENATDLERGITYGPFKAGRPNISPVRHRAAHAGRLRQACTEWFTAW